jgi:hypothetical protein
MLLKVVNTNLTFTCYCCQNATLLLLLVSICSKCRAPCCSLLQPLLAIYCLLVPAIDALVKIMANNFPLILTILSCAEHRTFLPRAAAFSFLLLCTSPTAPPCQHLLFYQPRSTAVFLQHRSAASSPSSCGLVSQTTALCHRSDISVVPQHHHPLTCYRSNILWYRSTTFSHHRNDVLLLHPHNRHGSSSAEPNPSARSIFSSCYLPFPLVEHSSCWPSSLYQRYTPTPLFHAETHTSCHSNLSRTDPLDQPLLECLWLPPVSQQASGSSNSYTLAVL